ncbi:MAG TPA: xanthine dehydrogenase family protein molybdopterin-binding subunit [Xanthobacteraceae bacterium]|nr:xanthine dehydrogenase family protein molybdopterin-binding subunit [Xanthobacteraceae bacterium]
MTFDPTFSSMKQGSRVEDDALMRGAGRFIDDAPLPGELHAYFLRSPHAHAKILSVDVEAARAAPAVIAVLTAADMNAAKITSIARHVAIANMVMPRRPPLADGRVLHVGQPVAAVIAETARQARDAAELIAVDYDVLASVVDLRAAEKPDAPQLWPEAPGNVVVDWPGPAPDPAANAAAVERVFASAAHVARVTVVNQRVIVAAMETRGATASYDAGADLYTLRACSQGAGALRDTMASIMGLAREQLRVVTEDVGGAFGMKSSAYPEYPVLLVAARRLGRPVHWMSDRSEAFISDNQARDAITDGELAMDDKGRFLALRIRHLANVGGFLANTGAHLATANFTKCFPAMYRIPHIDVRVRCLFTNTVPLGPYRGAGRPEANYVLERLVDEAARITGSDRARLRRRNLIPRSAMPYKTAVGTKYDSGDFAAVFDKALEQSDYAGFKKRRRESARRGRLRGIGISCFLEHSGGSPTEGALIAFPGGNVLSLGLHVQSTGQGHASVFPRLVAQKLGIAPEQVRHRHGDTNLDIKGAPSVASRSAMTAGSASLRAAETVLAKGRTVAAKALDVAEDKISYRDGYFEVAGTNHRLSLFDAAARAKEMAARGEIAETLDTQAVTDIPPTYPNGCHIAEVEVDPETGAVTAINYTAVDDSGRLLDHTLVEGQLHGGIAQGLGQALMELGYYDPDNGQLVTGSFQDYALPRAEDLPPIHIGMHAVPATTNPLGVKGVGEAGTTGSLAALMNAVADAIPGDAGATLDMPATSEKVWLACQQAKAAAE